MTLVRLERREDGDEREQVTVILMGMKLGRRQGQREFIPSLYWIMGVLRRVRCSEYEFRERKEKNDNKNVREKTTGDLMRLVPCHRQCNVDTCPHVSSMKEA